MLILNHPLNTCSTVRVNRIFSTFFQVCTLETHFLKKVPWQERSLCSTGRQVVQYRGCTYGLRSFFFLQTGCFIYLCLYILDGQKSYVQALLWVNDGDIDLSILPSWIDFLYDDNSRMYVCIYLYISLFLYIYTILAAKRVEALLFLLMRGYAK